MNGITSGHEEIQALLGVYALDAVTAEEHAAITRHLDGCDECRAEVDDHLEVAADLSAIAIAAPPVGLWDRIVDDLDPSPSDEADGLGAPPLRMLSSPLPTPTHLVESRSRDASDGTAVVSLADRRSKRSAWIAVASAVSVAAAMIVVLSVGWVRANDRASEADTALARPPIELAADRAMSDPVNRHLDLRNAAGEVTAVAVVTPSGEGYFLPRGLPELPDDRTYQLWQIGNTGPVSLGVFGNEPGVRGFHLQGQVHTLAITNESQGGRALPEGTPLATATA